MEVLETGIDELVDELKERGEASLEEISEKLGYPQEVVEEWAKVLEEHEILDIEYGFTRTKLKIKDHAEEKGTQAKEKLKKEKEESYTCEECGKSFDTEKGLQIHKGKAHK